MIHSLTEEQFLNGQVLLIDKPLDWTSFDAVNKLRYAIKKKFNIRKIKVGHAGTLDPLATGLLLICTGKSTKKINDFMGLDKEYTGLIRLGGSTPSYDLETDINETFPTSHITPELIETSRQSFLGEIKQVPPIFSAIKKDGEKAYDLARRGESIELKSRTVKVHEFEIQRLNETDLAFRIRCSKGTYIRSLAHDIGLSLKSGGHLASLRRTKIGDFDAEEAISPLDFVSELNK